MTKKKLNNLLNFLIFAMPIIALLIVSSVKYMQVSGQEITGLNDFMLIFINSFNNIPLFGQLMHILEICFNFSYSLDNVVILYLCAFIVYLIIATIFIIIKDLLLLIINICNKYIFLDD